MIIRKPERERIGRIAMIAIAATVLILGSAVSGAASCGDGNLDPGEDCDDGNTSNDDCCSAVCQVEAYGHPCVDSDPCTANGCDGTGGCGILPGCLSPGPPGSKNHGRSMLLLKHDATHETGDRLVWKWLRGSGATTIDDLGDPTSTTQYTVCLYAGTSAATIALPAGANWQAAAKGFKFKDPSGLPDGAQRALVKSGDFGKPKVFVKGKGANLPDAIAHPLPLPVTVQLVNDTNELCYYAVFNTALRNDSKLFKAKAP